MLQVTIHGYVVGPIWWPVGHECYKFFTYDLTREDKRFSEPGTLRDHVLVITNDGDFQHCEIADGYLEATTTKEQGSTVTRKTRLFNLSIFPSIADCVKLDWDGPIGDDDE